MEKATTPKQLLAIFLHKKFHRSDEGWEYEVERQPIGIKTTTIRDQTETETIWSTYADDYDNLHDWSRYSHKYYLERAEELLTEIKRLGFCS